MKILVIGGGGREHALCWKLSQSPIVEEVVCAPGNGGIGNYARCIPVSAEDLEGLIALAKDESVDLVVVGPEAPLVLGIVDRLEALGIPTFGPSAAAAQLEGSKAFSKDFMLRHGIPTAGFSTHEDEASALEEVERRGGRCVIKADGLAAGKGVLVCKNAYEAREAIRDVLGKKRFGKAGNSAVIEDLLVGEEASVLAICDGTRTLPLIAAQDHKAAFEGDTGPNTGGMGAYCPAPVVSEALAAQIQDQVLRRTVEGMAADGIPFKGLLYAGIMITDSGIKVLEFNVRFGDPECQPLLALMSSDLAPILLAAANANLDGHTVEWHPGAAICVVQASAGYPGAYDTGKEITGIDQVTNTDELLVFHAGTRKQDDTLVTAGGRVLGVTARGEDLREAANRAYEAASKITWPGMRMRRDIGHRAL